MKTEHTTPQQIADWLASLPHTTTITPMTVTINGTSYPAASYLQQFAVPEGSEAQRRGESNYWRSMIYVVGMLPACKMRGNVAFTIAGDPAEWYVAFYAGKIVRRKQEVRSPDDGAPFGNCFGLAPWDAPGTIDQYERVPYRRVAVTITREV